MNFDFYVTALKFIMLCFCEFAFLYIFKVDHESLNAFRNLFAVSTLLQLQSNQETETIVVIHLKTTIAIA